MSQLGQQFQHWADDLRGVSARGLLERFVVFGVFLLSLGLVWWCWHRIGPVDKEMTDFNRKIASLTSEIYRFDNEWSPEKLAALTNRYAAVTGKLFENREDYSSWEENVKQAAQNLGLSLDLKKGAAEDFKVGETNLYLLPITLTLQGAHGSQGAATPYKRVLRFVEQAAVGGKRAELTELAVSGASNSVVQAKLVVNLWSLRKAFP